jgi:tetratricopeptide (TPR) repeat protein
VEALNRRYEALRFDIDKPEKESEVNALLDDLAQFAGTRKEGYAVARAYAISGGIYGDKKNWAESAKAWDNAAAAAKGVYLEPVAFYNEAVALEEQNNTQGAIDLFIKAASFDDFPAAPRAQFNAGRLRESLDKNTAIEAYQNLLNKWPNENLWAALAQSRIIALTIGKH